MSNEIAIMLKMRVMSCITAYLLIRPNANGIAKQIPTLFAISDRIIFTSSDFKPKTGGSTVINRKAKIL